MHKYSPSPAPIVKAIDMEIFNAPGTNMSSIDKVKVVPYASAVESLQHAQVYTRPDLTFVTGFYLADFRAILE